MISFSISLFTVHASGPILQEKGILELAIPASCGMREVRSSLLHSATIPETVDRKLLVFALLELVSNALRAQREKAVNVPVMVRLEESGDRLLVSVEDRGGGFDPASLPFAPELGFGTPFSDNAVLYRESWKNARFGMGLAAVNRILEDFMIQYVDEDGRVRNEPSPTMKGIRASGYMPLRERPSAAGRGAESV